jgi:hypothetical protein
MDIFESLENLSVSEECFDEIMGIVEEVINEYDSDNLPSVARGMRKQNDKKTKALEKELKDLKAIEKRKWAHSEKVAGRAMDDPSFDPTGVKAYRAYKQAQDSEDSVKSKRSEVLDSLRKSKDLKRLTAQLKGRLN